MPDLIHSRISRALAVFVSHALVALIAIVLWSQRGAIADHLHIPPPPIPEYETSPKIHLIGDTGVFRPPCVEVEEVTMRPELGILHLANFEEPPIETVAPEYPRLAKESRISGTVVLEVTVGKDGNVDSLRALSGHPMLIQAAMQAVSQWRWKPFLLNGKPVRVASSVAIPFVFK